MADTLLRHLYLRFQPRHGWLPFVLLLAALTCLILSVLAVDWVPEDSVVVWAVL